MISTTPSFPRRAARLAVLGLLLIAPFAVAETAPSVDSDRALELMVPMRDGVRLATSVFLPAGDGPWPAVVQRTPYNKASASATSSHYTSHGFALVAQDQRGRFASEGEYQPHENELADGYDTVEWTASQTWSDGKVGISGASALGIAANLAAAADPPHLVAAYVTVAPESLFYEGRFIGGVFKEADTGNWMRGQGVGEDAVLAYKKRVVLDQHWQDKDFVFLRHRVDIPIYNVGGWYDLFLHGTLDNFRYLEDWGREGARGNQKVLVGPFGHGALQGDLEYPGAGSWRDSDEELRWFDYWLKGIDNGIMSEPKIRYYQRAAAKKGAFSSKNGYRTADSWPPNSVVKTRYYLGAAGKLGPSAPTVADSATRYRFDPAKPAPTFGGSNLTLPIGPIDQRKVGDRDDYLRFETAVLDSDLVLTGPVEVELWASTDGPDTDFMVKLVDVYPDGYEALVIDTAIRTRYRHGRRAQDIRMMTPGVPEKLIVDLWHTGLTVEKGHKLAVHVTSSNSPRFEVNPNTGEAPGESTRPPRVATNTIFHDAARPSAIVLPVMEPR